MVTNLKNHKSLFISKIPLNILTSIVLTAIINTAIKYKYSGLNSEW